ncbi:MAG: quinoprotein glucose dehydrogenase [Rhodothermales bacterium]|jgi:quinoprotein glucose dehydrogenase
MIELGLDRRRFIRCLYLLLLAATTVAEDPAAAQLATVKHPEDIRLSVFAHDAQLLNPVAICVDPAGKVYVAESLRQAGGVYGTASQTFWAFDDYRLDSLDQRRAMFAKYADRIPLADYSRIGEQIRLLADRDGDGRADDSRVIVKGFNGILAGAAAGIAERDGALYFTCIPSLWRLKDGQREALHTGFGIRVGIHGHDMHAPVWGPDGRLYFNIGDRGFSVDTIDGRAHHPTRGGVFRCEPDGTGLELFHIGLRNPQGMAFNSRGDLFTVDNNMSGGDKSRIVWITEGGDSGWDATYQLTRNFRKEMKRVDHRIEPPWFAEALWQTSHADQPAWVNPASAHLTAGPSGMDYYPGIGLPARYNDHFFVCDFRGGAGRSGIHAFRMEREGAGYRLQRSEEFLWGMLVSDCAFGFDGQLYIADWISGWRGANAGRIYRAVADSGKPLADGPSIYHPSLRVRQRAQFALAAENAESALIAAIEQRENLLARLHGVRGLGQIGRRRPAALAPLLAWLGDADADVRAECVRVLGDARYACGLQLAQCLSDSDLRVRLFAANALARLADPATQSPLRKASRQAPNGAQLRIALARALAAVDAVAADTDPTTAVLALRYRVDSRLADFLGDADPRVALEAARAIHDLPVVSALPALAALDLADKPDSFCWRIMNANFRIGAEENAQRIAEISRVSPSPERRQEALGMLAAWANPSPFDRVLWHHRPLGPRPDVSAVVEPIVGRLDSSPLDELSPDADISLLTGGDAPSGEQVYQTHAAECVRCHGVKLEGTEVGPGLRHVRGLPAEQILQSLIEPSATFAEGFAPPAGGPAISPMPPMGALLTRRELRDLTAFLRGQ